MEIKDSPQVQQMTAPVQPTPGAAPAPVSPAKMEAATDKAAVAEVTDAKAENDPDFASKFAALTRKQKEIYLREQQLKEREVKVSKYESLEKLKTENPFKFIQENGISLDEVIKGAAKDGEPLSLEDKLAAIEKKIADYEKKTAEDADRLAAQKQQEQIDTFRKGVFDKVKADPERYELIHLEDAFGTVYEVIEEHFTRTEKETGTGIIMDTDEAANLVEKFLQDKATKLLQAKKLGFKMAEKSPSPSDATPADAPAVKSEEREALTLSASLIPSSSADSPKYETPEEAKARIAREFNMRFRKQG